MTARTRAIAVAIATSTALLLTACGGSDDSSDDALPGIGEDSEQTDEDTDDADDADTGDDDADEPDDGRPQIELPDGVEMNFDWDEPEDPEEAAAVADAADYLRAITLAITEQDPEHELYRGLSSEGGRTYGHTQVTGWVDGGWTKSGKDRYFNLATRKSEGSIAVAFCRDNSEMFSKEIDSGKLVPKDDRGELDHLGYYSIVMSATPGPENTWYASYIEVEAGAEQCVG
ncbi:MULTISPECIES: hypothetical protein [unclassified Streptomyces]|uniref:hypothetical protein n=1 Tax=unclassified Streptomyces TaxID=2593676 RepID=UPI000CD4EF13|nr:MULTISPECIES: hypothetical protein [unclassified Streptomyces]